MPVPVHKTMGAFKVTILTAKGSGDARSRGRQYKKNPIFSDIQILIWILTWQHSGLSIRADTTIRHRQKCSRTPPLQFQWNLDRTLHLGLMASSSSSSSPASNVVSTDSHADDADLAKVWAELSRGEKTAQALESNLTNLEKKIDALLASVESQHEEQVQDGDGDGDEGATATASTGGGGDDKDKAGNADSKS
ncbi:hypothetical protein LCER1_G004213 [Lachnellula cervina]|uniref:Uncharacterized protein n=1 Tax=Lachnellula cervina TaxID=1316786 RepID=A0A7D8YTT4_9HELO|nr:hypothetical protein LCER1_G004213 [Lachnellula cervina]